MVLSGVGFKRKPEGSEIGTGLLEMPWTCSTYVQHLQKSGSIGAYLSQSFVVLFVNVSSICPDKGVAPLHCICNEEAPQGLWMGCGCCMLMGRAISLTVSSVLRPHCRKKIAKRFVLAPACGSYSIKRCEKHLRITQGGFHIRASRPQSM